MAALTSPHWEVISTQTRELLKVLGRLPVVRPFYLGGGTALALRLGHRVSQDLDLFANIETLNEDLRRQLVTELRQTHLVNLRQDSIWGLVLEADNQAVSFFTYGYSLLSPTDVVDGLQIASLLDIGLMKLDAIAGRGARKDFYDVYFIAQQILLDDLFARSADKYPRSRGFGMRVLAALVDFDTADQQDDPIILLPVTWDQVKSFFVAEARRLGEKWFT